MKHPFLKVLPALLIASVSSACGTAPQVHDLAKATASNASLVNTELANFATVSRRTAESRAAAASRLTAAVQQERAAFEGYLASAQSVAMITGRTEPPNFATLVIELRRVSEQIHARQREPEIRAAAVQAEILGSQAALTLPKDRLATVAAKLAVLSEAPDRKQQLTFYRTFLTEVVAAIKTAKADAESSASTATAGSETVTVTLEAGSKTESTNGSDE